MEVIRKDFIGGVYFEEIKSMDFALTLLCSNFTVWNEPLFVCRHKNTYFLRPIKDLQNLICEKPYNSVSYVV